MRDHQKVTPVDRLRADGELRKPVRIDDVNALRGPQLHLGPRHPADGRDPGAGGIDHHLRARLGHRAVGGAIADTDHSITVAQQLDGLCVVQGPRAMGDRVLHIRVDQAMWVDAPFLHAHGADDVAGKAGLDLARLFGGEAHVRVSLL